MKKTLLAILLIIVLAFPAFAQTYFGVGLIPRGTSTPATCNEGTFFWDTDNDILYVCEPADTWKSAGGGGDVSIYGTPLQYDWAVWNSGSAIKGVSVGSSSVACTDSNGEPTACSNLADSTYLTPSGSGASLTDIPLDADFTSNGFMLRTSAGAYGIGSTFDIPMGGNDYVLMGESGSPYNAEQIAPATALAAMAAARGDVGWTNYYSSSTVTGFDTLTDTNISYKVVDDIVYVNVALNGTNNSTTTLTFTVPYTSANVEDFNAVGLACIKSAGAWQTTFGRFVLVPNSNIVNVYTNAASGAFPSDALGKGVIGQFWYRK